MRLVMDMPLNVANSSQHWAVRARAKKAYYVAQDRRQLLGLIEPPPSRPMKYARLAAHFYAWSLMDDDNRTARLKFVCDWLKTRGYIVDDKPSCLTITAVTQEIDRANQRLVVTLEPVG